MDNLNIYQKLVKIRKKVEFLKKEQGKQYNYVSSSKVLISIRDYLNEYGLLLIPECIDSEIIQHSKEKQDKIIITYFVKAKMRMTWVNIENPEEKIVVLWEGHGVDIAGEKGIGKAYTYAEKYFILKQFNIPTDKLDPDVIQNQIKNDNSDKIMNKIESLMRENEILREENKKIAEKYQKAKEYYKGNNKESDNKEDNNNQDKKESEKLTRMKITQILLRISNGNKDKALQLLESLTSFKDENKKIIKGVKCTNDLSGKRLFTLYGKLKQSYPDITKEVKEILEDNKKKVNDEDNFYKMQEELAKEMRAYEF